jgi:hypothetical protein
VVRWKFHYPIKEDLDMAAEPLDTFGVEESMPTPKRMDLGATIISSGVKEMPLIRLLPNDRVIISDVKWHSLIPQSCVLEKPSVAQLLRNFNIFTLPEGPLQCSQEPSTGPYPEPNQFSPYHKISKIYFNILPPISRSSK